MVETEKNTLRILLIEDTPGDVRLITEGFKRTKLSPIFTVVGDGKAALHFLFKTADLSELPEMILLDLNLPLIGGHEVLKQIKSSRKTDHIPVVILTSSLLDDDITKAINGEADLYVIKPINLNEYFEAISKIERFWINFNSER